MNLSQAKEVTGGLSKPSKMPGYAFNLPAASCPNGRKLRKQPNSICSKCYASKGRYCFPKVKQALNNRLSLITHYQWADAMTILVEHYSEKVHYFRWHDSGDLKNMQHLESIIQVCKATPKVNHWLPTKSYELIVRYLKTNSFPDNLNVRLSGWFIDAKIADDLLLGVSLQESELLLKHCTTSTVHKNTVCAGNKCPAASQENQCKDCRFCWDKACSNVAYPLH